MEGNKIKDEKGRFIKGHTPYNKGIPLPEYVKEKISKAAKGRIITEETRRKMSLGNKGKKMSEEAINKIKEARKKQIFSKETRLKMSLAKIGKTAWNKGKPLSEETKLKLRIALKGKRVGEQCYNWIKDRSLLKEPIDKQIRKSEKYKEWRSSIFERDNYTCQICKKYGCELNADHIKSFAEYPELRFELDNGRTLCVECHRKTENYGLNLVHKKRKKILNGDILFS